MPMHACRSGHFTDVLQGGTGALLVGELVGAAMHASVPAITAQSDPCLRACLQQARG